MAALSLSGCVRAIEEVLAAVARAATEPPSDPATAEGSDPREG
jgi:hypothetical protein